MARKPRVVVPETVDDDTEEIVYDHPGLNAWRKSGDYAVLSDPSFSEWEWTVYRLHTPDEVTRLRPATPRLWVTRVTGPLDIYTIQANYGGGTFEFWGKYESELRTRIKVDLSGPRKDFNAAPVAPAVAVAAAPAVDPTLVRVLENQQRSLDRLEAAVRAQPQAAAQPFGIKDAFELFDRMQGRTMNGGDLGEITAAFREGIALRDSLGGAPERDKLEIILERVMPTIERVGAAMLTRSAAVKRAPAPPAPSHATVVDPAAPPTAVPTEPVVEVVDPGDHRMRTAVEVLANAIAVGDDPLDTADVVGRILQPQELGLLRMMPDEAVISQLRASAAGQFPVLERPEAAVFLGAVLKELREPSPPVGD